MPGLLLLVRRARDRAGSLTGIKRMRAIAPRPRLPIRPVDPRQQAPRGNR
jgi:hypothetical protein